MATIPDHRNENDLFEESDDPARPVFVDPSGRRRSIIRRVAIGVCVAVGCYGILLAAALFGAPTLPAALVPVPRPEPQVTTEVPATTAEKPAPAKPSEPETSESDRDTSTTRPPGTPATGLSGTTSQQPSVTSAPPGTDRRNSRAPDVPPGQTRTERPGNGR